jgi:hypothetical protein
VPVAVARLALVVARLVMTVETVHERVLTVVVRFAREPERVLMVEFMVTI